MLLISRLKLHSTYCNELCLQCIFNTECIFSRNPDDASSISEPQVAKSPPLPRADRKCRKRFPISTFHRRGQVREGLEGGGRSIGGAVAAPPPLRLTIFNCHASRTITLSLPKNSTCSRARSVIIY